MKDTLIFIATSVVVMFFAVNALILMVLYVKWVSKIVGAL